MDIKNPLYAGFVKKLNGFVHCTEDEVGQG